MPIKHPIDGETLYGVREASLWFGERGLQMSVPSLNGKRTRGGGPRVLRIGRLIYYRESALREYLLSKITDEASSTSEMKVAKQLLIEDKSVIAHPNGEGE